MSRIITLTTDFGDKDYYVGAIKGIVYSINPLASIVDISHQIKFGDIGEASFVIKAAYKCFPKGTIHLVVVDPGVGSDRRIVIVKSNDYYFVAPDNGVLSYAIDQLKDIKIFEVTNKKYFLKNISHTFHGRDIFAPVVAYLAKGVAAKEFGEKIDNLVVSSIKKVYKKDQTLIGEVVYIDKFGNLITNFTPHDLSSLRNIYVRINNCEMFQINSFYAQSKIGSLLAIWGSYGYLEISVNQGNAEKYLNAKKGDIVSIRESK
ncbi:MAG: SAM-dependent chlorinase/fluorinase [bacterium]|nr:SAM-dependent chlorinase/fluorinase [bacterium]